MVIENDDLVYNKYLCVDCGKPVVAHTVKDVIKNEKKCADCSIIDVTGGFKPKYPNKVLSHSVKKLYSPNISLDADTPNNLRRDISKNKKPKHRKLLTPKEKALLRQKDEEKWERIRAEWKSIDIPNISKSNSGE